MAITTPIKTIDPSTKLHRPTSIMFARTGPTTASMKAEKEPKKAIIELNSGIMMDTATESKVMHMRWRMASARLTP